MFLLYQRASLFTNRKFSYSSEVITRVFLSKRQFTLFNKGRRNITAKKNEFLVSSNDVPVNLQSFPLVPYTVKNYCDFTGFFLTLKLQVFSVLSILRYFPRKISVNLLLYGNSSYIYTITNSYICQWTVFSSYLQVSPLNHKLFRNSLY